MGQTEVSDEDELIIKLVVSTESIQNTEVLKL